MKTYHTAIRLLLLVLLSATQVQAADIKISAVTARIEDDSLCIEMVLDVSAITVKPSVSFIFTPVLQSRGKLMELPPVVVTGKRRARFDRREVIFTPPTGHRQPLAVVHGNGSNRGNRIGYRVRVPYGLWMGNASLALMHEVKDCCDRQLLGIESLMADLAISGIRIPTQGEGYVADTPQADVPAPGTAIANPCPPSPYADMVSYLEPHIEAQKQRTGSAKLYIDYLTGRYELQPAYKRNRAELLKLDSLMAPLRHNPGQVHLQSIRICGYASPEGSYARNEALSSNRARYFMNYMLDTYRLPEPLFHVSWVPEDWSSLAHLVEQQRPFGYREVSDVIRSVSAFDRREKILTEMLDGKPYTYLTEHIYPLLRRIEITVSYSVEKVATEQAAELIYTRPQLLSLQEMYRVARYYRPGTEQYREVYEIAAHHFPTDAVASINAASAALLTGDLVSARTHLERCAGDARAWNNLGVLAWAKGEVQQAATWWRKALGVEPHKARKNLRRAEEELKKQEKEGKPQP